MNFAKDKAVHKCWNGLLFDTEVTLEMKYFGKISNAIKARIFHDFNSSWNESELDFFNAYSKRVDSGIRIRQRENSSVLSLNKKPRTRSVSVCYLFSSVDSP